MLFRSNSSNFLSKAIQSTNANFAVGLNCPVSIELIVFRETPTSSANSVCDIFISQRIGYNKPKIEFFNGCFEKMNNPNIEGMIIIGDSLSSDILGGINAGIHTCWYNPKRSENMTEIKPEYEIDSLDKIFKVLEEI